MDKRIIGATVGTPMNPQKIIEKSTELIPDWAKQPEKPSYTADEVGAMPEDVKIPTKISELENDSGYLTEHQDLSSYLKKTERIEVPLVDAEVELEPNKLYVFPEVRTLKYRLKKNEDDKEVSEYHFIFVSGETATEVVHPEGVNIGFFKVDANKVYEISIMEGLLSSQSWEITI